MRAVPGAVPGMPAPADAVAKANPLPELKPVTVTQALTAPRAPRPPQPPAAVPAAPPLQPPGLQQTPTQRAQAEGIVPASHPVRPVPVTAPVAPQPHEEGYWGDTPPGIQRPQPATMGPATGSPLETPTQRAQEEGIVPRAPRTAPIPFMGRPSFPAWLSEPLLPKITALGDTIDDDLVKYGSEVVGKLSGGRLGGEKNYQAWLAEQAQKKQQLASYDAAHPVQAQVAQHVENFVNGMTSPTNLAVMAMMPESRVIALLFAAQAAHGTYSSSAAAYRAFKEGKNPQAWGFVTDAGLNGLMAAFAGRYGLRGKPVPGTAQPSVEVPTERPALAAPEVLPPEHPAGTVTGIDQQTGLPIVDRAQPPAARALPAPAAVPRGTEEAGAAPISAPPVEPESGRPILQGSSDAAAIAAEAKQLAPALEQRLEQATAGVPGARVEAVRDVKDADRVEEKAGAGKPVETQPDHLAARVVAETPEAKEAVAQRLAQQGEIQREDNFGKNGGPNDFRADTHQVTVPGQALRSAEVQIVTPEQHATAERLHDLYEQQRTAAAEGDTKKAEELGAQLAEANRQAAAEAEERQKQVPAAVRSNVGGIASPNEPDILNPPAAAAPQAGTIEPALPAETEAAHAVREPGGGGLFQPPPEEAGAAGGGRGRVEPGQQRAEAAEARPEGAATATEAGAQLAPGAVGRMRTADLAVDPKRFQYKMGTDASGATSLLKGRPWNPELAGVITVWRDPASGRTWVVNGHHRFDLARANGVDSLNVLSMDARDAAEARARGALQNIAEGRGTPMDAAKFFRDSGYTPQDLDRLGVSLGEATAANGLALARLDPRIFDDVVSGKIPQGRAIAIGSATDSPVEQEAILKLIDRAEARGRRVTNDTVGELARLARGAGEHRETQTDLFGTTETARNLALEKAEVSAYIREQIGKEQRLFASVADPGRAQKLARGENVIHAERNAEIARQAAQARELYDRLSTRTGPLDELLNRAAEELAQGKGNAGAVKQGAYEAARAELSRQLAAPVAGAAEAERGGLRARPGEAQEPEPAAAQRSVAASGIRPGAAPRPPVKPETWKKGETFLLPMPDGRWASGTVEHAWDWTDRGGKAGGRARLSDGTKVDEIPRDAVRIRTLDGPVKPITGTPAEREMIARVERDQARYVADAITNPKNYHDGVLAVATDAAKDQFPEFRADPVGTDRDVAAAAGRINKAVLENALAHPVDPARPEVQIVTASPGSGKTRDNMLNATPPRIGLKIEHISDDFDSSRRLFQKVINSGRRPVLHWVYVDDFGKTVERMFRRAIGHDGKPGIGRTVQLNYMVNAYKSVPEVVARLRDHFGDQADFFVIDNSGPKGAHAEATRDISPYLDGMRGQGYHEIRNRLTETVRRLQDEGLFQSELGRRSLAAAQATDTPEAQNPRGSGPTTGSGAEGLERGVGAVPGEPGPRGALLGTPPEEYARQIAEARKRPIHENAALARPTVIQTGRGPAVALDADSYGFWHRSHAGQRTLDNGELEKPVAWRGLTLPRRAANEIAVRLRAMAGSARAKPGGAAWAAGIDRLTAAIGEARHPDGSVTLLRGDYRPDTVREEDWHHWQMEHGLDDSEALRAVAQMPEFREAADSLRAMGYGLKRGPAGQSELAQEMMAKALAGDPELALTSDQRYDVVHAYLTAAADEVGAHIFGDMPEATPEAEAAIREARRSYDYEAGEGPGAGGGGAPVRGGGGPAGEGSAGRGPNPRADGLGAGPAGTGGERGVRPVSEAEGELKFQRGRLPGEQPLPGMEADVRAQDEAAAEEQGRTLTEAMREPGKDISRRAGEMERAAPLFEGSEAGGQGFLFQKDTDPENPVAKSLRDLIADVEKMPRPEQGTRLDQVADWLGSKAGEGVDRTGAYWAEKPAAVERGLAKAKLVFAAMVDHWRNPLPETDWKKTVGQMQLARTEAALQMRDFARELKAAAPDKLRRIAMSHWIEAGGDPKQLRDWAVKARERVETLDPAKVSRPLARAWQQSVAHYEAAEKLTPEQKALAQRLKQHMDEMLAEAKKQGLLEYGARNYVRHLYRRADAEQMLRLIDSTELDPNPSFVEHRVFRNYFDAEQHGMIPRDKDVGTLVAAYDKSFSQALASRAMLRDLLDAKDAKDGRPLAAVKGRGKWVMARSDQMPLVMEQRERPASLAGYRQYDLAPTRNFLFEPTVEDLEGYEHDPKLFEDDPGKLAFRGDLIFHPSIASRVEDMLTPGWFDRNETLPQRIGHGILYGSSLAKELMTAVAPFHLVQETGRGAEAKTFFNPLGEFQIDLSGGEKNRSKDQRLLVANGLALTDFDAEGLFSAKALKGLGEGIPGLNVALDAMNAFSRWQFEEYIPGLKMKTGLKFLDWNRKHYAGKLSDRQMAEMAAKGVNARFGNLNTAFDAMPRSKTFKQLLRLSTFAPDFLESTMREYGQAFTRYGGAQRASLIRAALMMYVTARLANALLNHGDTKPDPEHAFTIVIDGRNYSLRTDVGDFLHLVTDPRGFIYNRLNPLTTRPAIEFLSGRDQYGRQKSFPHQAKDLAKSTLPFGVQKVIQTSHENWLDSLLTSTGLQASIYRTPAEEATHKLYLEGLPDLPDDEEREAAGRKYAQIEDKLREGKMKPAEVWAEVKSGELSPMQAARAIRRSQKSRLELEFASGAVRLPDAVKIFEEANPAERMELRPALVAKAEHELPEMPEEQRAKLAAQVEKLLEGMPSSAAPQERASSEP